MAISKELSVVLAGSKLAVSVAQAPLNLSSIGSAGISLAAALLSRNKEFAGTPIPSVWADMIMPPVNIAAPIATWFNMAITMGAPRLKGIGGYVQSILSFIPVLGGVVSAMLGQAFGKSIQSFKSPYYYYDPATRGISQGIQKGEPQDQFASAYTDWNNVYATLEARLAKEYETKFGSSEGASEEARKMINGTSEKGRELEAFLNPVEKRILANYNALFNTAANPLLGGPSPHMVSLASQGS